MRPTRTPRDQCGRASENEYPPPPLAFRTDFPTSDLFCNSVICIVKQADAGWSSSVARRAHNPEVTGSNPVPATSSPSASGLAGIFLPRAGSRVLTSTPRNSATWNRSPIDHPISPRSFRPAAAGVTPKARPSSTRVSLFLNMSELTVIPTASSAV